MNGWIVCYVLRTKDEHDVPTDTDHYEVFIDDGMKNNHTAKHRFDQLCKGGKKKEFPINVEVYSANLCRIVDSTEATYLNIPI